MGLAAGWVRGVTRIVCGVISGVNVWDEQGTSVVEEAV